MPETFVELGSVTAPSGVLVHGMAGWIDYWRELDQPRPPMARDRGPGGAGPAR